MARTKVEIALGDVDYGLDPDQYDWTDWTAYVEREEIGVYTWRGYRDGSSEPSATEIRFRGKNADRRWSIWSALNPYFGEIRKRTPIRVSRDYGTAVTRATAYLTNVSLGTSANGRYRWADVEAFGRLDHEEGQDDTASVLYQQLANKPYVVAYWPGEDASGSTVITSAVPGQPDAAIFGSVSFGADAEILGSKPLWQLTDGIGAVYANLAPYARPYPEQWAVLLVIKVPAEPGAASPFFGVTTDGASVQQWAVRIVPGAPAALELMAFTPLRANVLTGTTTVNLVDEDGNEPWGKTIGILIKAEQNGADIDWAVRHYSTHTVSNSGSGASGTLTGYTLGPVTGVSAGLLAGLAGWTYGHWAVLNSTARADFVYFNGYKGTDVASAAFQVAVDADWPMHFTGSTVTTSTVGPMGTESPASKLKTLMRSEGGLLYETAGGLIRPMTRAELTSQAVALTINYASKQILDLVPVEDSLRAANRVTANSDVGSATADAPSPHDPVSVGWTRGTSIDVNLEDIAQVRGAAQFEVALQSYPDYRYAVTLELDGPASGLRSTFLSDVDIGSRVQITNPPNDFTLDTIDQQIMSIEESGTEQAYTVTLGTRPAGVWQAFIAENGTANLSRADTTGSRLLVPIVAADTALLVGTYGDADRQSSKWSTTALPYDLALRAYDRVTCTAVTNRTPTFVSVGTAAHADNAAVTPGAGAGIVAGDLDLLLCSIRDSTGFAYLGGVADDEAFLVGDQLGWKRLAKFGGENGCFALYARTYQAGDADPVLTPVVGSSVAGDTVSAQRATIRYVQPVIHRTSLAQANASAANVAYPALSGMLRANTLVILAIQKDDDLTSTTAPAGFTKIADASSTLGSDQAIAWYYQIQTTPTDIAAGSVTVSGGAANTSKAVMVSLIGDVQTLTCTRGVNGAYGTHPLNADVRLWRAGRLTR